MRRVTGIGGIFFKAKDPIASRTWMRCWPRCGRRAATSWRRRKAPNMGSSAGSSTRRATRSNSGSPQRGNERAMDLRCSARDPEGPGPVMSWSPSKATERFRAMGLAALEHGLGGGKESQFLGLPIGVHTRLCQDSRNRNHAPLPSVTERYTTPYPLGPDGVMRPVVRFEAWQEG